MTRSAVVPIRLTPEERSQLQEKAKCSRISLSEYVRRMAFSRRMPARAAPEVNKQTYQELARVGNNLNQLLRAIHEGKVPLVNPGSLPELQELKVTLKEIGLQVLGEEVTSS